MTRHRAAAAVWAVTIAYVAAVVTIDIVHPRSTVETLSISTVVLAFSTVGMVLCRQAPGNVIGPLFLGFGAMLVSSGLAEAYARAALEPDGPHLPGAMAAAVYASAAQGSPVVALLVYTLLLFPDGAIASRRLRPLGYVAAVAALAATTYTLLQPGPLGSIDTIDNPIAAGGTAARVIGVVGTTGYLALVGVMLAAAGSLMVRFRRSTGVLRQQLKVLGAAAALLAGSFLTGALILFQVHAAWADAVWLVLFVVSTSALPVTTGVAIVRYRLYGIDAVIRRTLVYATLVACLGLLYLAAIVAASGVSRAITGQSGALAVTISTLAVAALARPLQRRIQAAVDRRFFRSRYDAQATVIAFGERLRDEVGLEMVARELVIVADGAVHPAHASLWLRPLEVPRRVGPKAPRVAR